MHPVQDFITRRDELAKHLQIELLEVGEGTAVARMPIRKYHLNGVRTIHGGAVFSLGDLAFAAASNSHGTVAMGISVSITYMKSAREGETLTARARELSRNPKLANYTVEIRNDSEELIALFQGMVYRKKESLADHND